MAILSMYLTVLSELTTKKKKTVGTMAALVAKNRR